MPEKRTKGMEMNPQTTKENRRLTDGEIKRRIKRDNGRSGKTNKAEEKKEKKEENVAQMKKKQ